MRVNIPPGQSGRWKVHVLDSLFDRFTVLTEDDQVWMVDTEAEQADIYPMLAAAEAMKARTVLVHGLGLGMVLPPLMEMDHVEHVDVVEISDDVCDLVAPHYDDERIRIHHGDAFTYPWWHHSKWDIVWHDIWLGTPDPDEVERLYARFKDRCQWQGHWRG